MPAPVLVVTGQSIAKELLDAIALLGLTYDDDATATVVTDLLSRADGHAWTLDTIDAGLSNTTARFDGPPLWSCLAKVADLHNLHVRTVRTQRKLQMGAFGAASGVRLIGIDAMGNQAIDTNVGIIKRIGRQVEYENVINRIIPVGAGEGNNLFTMKYSTRSSPYVIKTMAGPDGETLYYLEDDASVQANGRVTRIFSFKDVAPIANSPIAFENSSNALYDLGSTALQDYKDAPATYTIEAIHVLPTIKPGDTIFVAYRGWGEDADGRRVYLNISEDLVVMSYGRSFDYAGRETTSLVLSTVSRYQLTDQEVQVGMLETLQAFKTAVKFYTYETHHGTERESIQFSGSNWFTYPMRYDANISVLLRALLTVQINALKSNVTDAASGGGSTSGSGGGQTSSGGSSHSHSVSGGTSSGGSSHSHSIPANNTLNTQDTEPATPHLHSYAGQTSNSESSHTHSISGSTSGSETGHTHTVSSHTHSVSAHTHALTYGIFLSSLPAAPAVQVWINGTDRTGALGGPWNTDVFDLDVTPYLLDADGHPLRQVNTIQIRKPSTAPDAIDVVVAARSLVVASALQPV